MVLRIRALIGIDLWKMGLMRLHFTKYQTFQALVHFCCVPEHTAGLTIERYSAIVMEKVYYWDT